MNEVEFYLPGGIFIVKGTDRQDHRVGSGDIEGRPITDDGYVDLADDHLCGLCYEG